MFFLSLAGHVEQQPPEEAAIIILMRNVDKIN